MCERFVLVKYLFRKHYSDWFGMLDKLILLLNTEASAIAPVIRKITQIISWFPFLPSSSLAVQDLSGPHMSSSSLAVSQLSLSLPLSQTHVYSGIHFSKGDGMRGYTNPPFAKNFLAKSCVPFKRHFIASSQALLVPGELLKTAKTC